MGWIFIKKMTYCGAIIIFGATIFFMSFVHVNSIEVSIKLYTKKIKNGLKNPERDTFGTCFFFSMNMYEFFCTRLTMILFFQSAHSWHYPQKKIWSSRNRIHQIFFVYPFPVFFFHNRIFLSDRLNFFFFVFHFSFFVLHFSFLKAIKYVNID